MYDAEQFETSDEEVESEFSTYDENMTERSTEELPQSGEPEEILLFKVTLKIEVSPQGGKKLESCDFYVSFLSLPEVILKNKTGKSVTFPSSKTTFFSSANPKLKIIAFHKNENFGETEVYLDEEFRWLYDTNERCRDRYPIEISKAENMVFDGEYEVVGEAYISVDIQCLGPIDVADCDAETPAEDGIEPEYDEYVADINGHTLNISILRKPGQADECDCVCSCTGGGKCIPVGGVAKAGSQFIFQMPNKSDLCNKDTTNASLAYNVGTCKNEKSHHHGNEKIKVHTGSMNGNVKEASNVDTFFLKLGKKTAVSGVKGRLELELVAPKPATADDFKKPSFNKSVQTDQTKKKGKKTKGNKRV